MGLTADINANLRRVAQRFIDGVIDRLAPRPTVQQQAGLAAAALLERAKREVAQRSASVPPPIVPGTGQSYGGTGIDRMVNADQQRRFGAPDAMRGRATAFTGPSPQAYTQYPEITIGYIAQDAGVEVRLVPHIAVALDVGMNLREHEHCQPADRSRRAWIFSAPMRLRPRNETRLALLVRNAVQAVLDDIDGFDSSVCEMQIANMSGPSLTEVVYRPRRLRVVVDRKRATVVDSECVASLEAIPLRSTAFDIETDKIFVNQGGWGWIDPFKDPWSGRELRKVVYHKAYGDGPARLRGYGFAAHHMHWMSKFGWEKLGNLAEVYGLPTPYLQPKGDEQITDEDYAQGEQALADLGKAIPAILNDKLGEVKTTPVPSAVTPIQQALIGMANTGLSKLITGQTLLMEMGGVGSYNAGDNHADQQEAVQRIDAKLTAGTLNSQLLRYIVELNAAAWALAFAPYSEGEPCTPDTIRQCVPWILWDVSRKLTKVERLKMFIDAADAGLQIDTDQVYEECAFRPALSPDTALRGTQAAKPSPQTAGAAAPPAAADDPELPTSQEAA